MHFITISEMLGTNGDIAAATKMILDAANSNEIRECGIDSLTALAKLSILRRIEASLIEIGVHVSVTVEDDLKSVRLYRLVHSQEKKQEIEPSWPAIKSNLPHFGNRKIP